MFNKHLTLFLKITVILTLFGNISFAQDDKESLAYQYINNNKAEEAYPIFKDLVRLYPNDPKLNYYYIVSALSVENTKELEKCFQIASEFNSYNEILFHKGYYHQIKKEWKQAIELFDQFKQKGRRKDIKKLNVDEHLNDCRTQFAKQEIEVAEQVVEEAPIDTTKIQKSVEPKKSIKKQAAPVTVQPVAVTTPKKDKNQRNERKPIETPSELHNKLLEVRITDDIIYRHISQFRNADAKAAFIKQWNTQRNIAMAEEELNSLRAKYSNAAKEDARKKITTKLIALEENLFHLQQMQQREAHKAYTAEKEVWEAANDKEKSKLIEESKKWYNKLSTAINDASDNNETIIIKREPVKQVVVTEYSYKIQIGAYRKKLPPYIKRLFDKIAIFRTVQKYTDDKGIVVYTTGETHTYADAQKLLKQVKSEGVEGASIAAYKNNKRVSVREAKAHTD